MQRKFNTNIQKVGQLSLVGLRMDPNFGDSDFYTILLDDHDYWPITYNGYIIFFQKLEAAQIALDLYSNGTSFGKLIAPNQITLVCDFAQVFYLLSKKTTDDSSYILNTINILLDMLKATSVYIPPFYKDDLQSLADHLTFEKEFKNFLEELKLESSEIIEAIQWALGAVISKSMFIPKANINS